MSQIDAPFFEIGQSIHVNGICYTICEPAGERVRPRLIEYDTLAAEMTRKKYADDMKVSDSPA